MLTTHFRVRQRLPEFRRHLISTTSGIMAMLLWSGLAGSVRADEQTAAPRYDRAVLSEIAQDVLRPPATRPEHSRAKSGASEADAREEAVEVGTADEPVSPVTHIAPAQEGITVAIPPGLAPAAKVVSEWPRPAISPTPGGSARPPRADSASPRASARPGRGSTPR